MLYFSVFKNAFQMYSIIMVSLEVILHKSYSVMLEFLSVSWQTVFDYKFMLHRTHNFRSTLECFQILFWNRAFWLLFNNLNRL